MANKKELKREINYICSELFAECVAASLYNVKGDNGNVNALLSSILLIHDDYVRRVSHPEPGMKPKKFFGNLKNSFNKQIGEVVDQICNLY